MGRRLIGGVMVAVLLAGIASRIHPLVIYYVNCDGGWTEEGAVWTYECGALRTRKGHCPLSFVADTSLCSVVDSRRALRMRRNTSDLLIMAADDYRGGSQREQRLRKQLERAVGL